MIFNTYGQEQKKENSKIQEFASKKGTIIKFENYKLDNIRLTYGMAESEIRKIIVGDEAQYFLQISKKGKYDTKTASIAYEDIIEIQKALKNLSQQSEIDINTISDYLENKFVTEDGFQIGYYINKGKIRWYASLEKYGSDNTIFFKDFETVEIAFHLGKTKIEELK
ncbi:hypothetical protein [uncultured Psychroserpens sp.]|uniref:hypothetical protein n=1 Tax=uncultured Psychroserpens sp. TaxID=255436 RepID=UPI002612416A|nr:hypothetical protein [uncultured Psychroserpens sp.]